MTRHYQLKLKMAYHPLNLLLIIADVEHPRLICFAFLKFMDAPL